MAKHCTYSHGEQEKDDTLHCDPFLSAAGVSVKTIPETRIKQALLTIYKQLPIVHSGHSYNLTELVSESVRLYGCMCLTGVQTAGWSLRGKQREWFQRSQVSRERHTFSMGLRLV